MGDAGLIAILIAAFVLVIGLVRLADTLIGSDLPHTEADEQFSDHRADGPQGGRATTIRRSPCDPMEPM